MAHAPDARRASVVGEFGALGLAIEGHMWDAAAWQYGDLSRGRAALADRYDRLLRKAWRLKDDPGISAVVYCQTADTETEPNGLLTYDRAVLRMDRARAIAANTGRLSPEVPPTVVVPASRVSPRTWRYTTSKPADGWMRPDFDAAGWKAGPGGFGTPATLGVVARTRWDTPDIWIRRAFSLPDESRSGYALLLHHDEEAEVYLNGALALEAGRFTTDYEEYPIAPAALAALKTGENVMAIHCHQTTGDQYVDAGIVKR